MSQSRRIIIDEDLEGKKSSSMDSETTEYLKLYIK